MDFFFKYNPVPHAWTNFHLVLSTLLGFIWKKLNMLDPSYKMDAQRLEMPCCLIERHTLMPEAKKLCSCWLNMKTHEDLCSPGACYFLWTIRLRTAGGLCMPSQLLKHPWAFSKPHVVNDDRWIVFLFPNLIWVSPIRIIYIGIFRFWTIYILSFLYRNECKANKQEKYLKLIKVIQNPLQKIKRLTLVEVKIKNIFLNNETTLFYLLFEWLAWHLTRN